MTDREKYIETVGMFYEKYELPKMAGRILGYLISSETDNNSFDDLKEALIASKGSISANLKTLLNQNFIEKHMVKGDRKSYYRIKLDNSTDIINNEIQVIRDIKRMYEKGNSFKIDKINSNYNSVSEIVELCAFLEKEMALLYEKWKNNNN